MENHVNSLEVIASAMTIGVELQIWVLKGRARKLGHNGEWINLRFSGTVINEIG